MLNYHLNEVNNVVATMQLDDPDGDDDEHDDSHSEYTTSEYQDEDTPYTSGLSDSDAESEDEFGRSKHPAVTDAYRDEMEALKARLIGNLGKIALPDAIPLMLVAWSSGRSAAPSSATVPMATRSPQLQARSVSLSPKPSM